MTHEANKKNQREGSKVYRVKREIEIKANTRRETLESCYNLKAPTKQNGNNNSV